MHIFQPELNQKSYSSATIVHTEIICSVIYVQYTNILFKYKVLVSPRLAHTRAANIHTTHKGKHNSTDGARGVREARAPFVCGVNVGNTCVCVCVC